MEHSYLKKRIAIIDEESFTNEFIVEDKGNFKIWLYAKWIEHLRDNIRAKDIIDNEHNITNNKIIYQKKFYLYLKFTEYAGREPYLSQYIKDNYSYLVPTLISQTSSDETPGWLSLKKKLKNCKLSNIIEEICLHEKIPDEEHPVIAYPRHGASADRYLEYFLTREKIKHLIYSENLSGESPHFNLIASPPQDDYQLQKLALWLIEGGLLRIAIADERISKEIGNQLWSLNIINIFAFKKGDDEVVPVVTESEQTNREIVIIDGVKLLRYYPILDDTYPIDIDVLIIHQGILDKFIKNKFFTEDELVSWLKALKQSIPFIVVTSGRGTPEKIPKNVKFLPFSDIGQSFKGKHSTKLLLTYFIMYARSAKGDSNG